MNQHILTIVSAHNRYLSRGGEDEVFESETRLLQQHGRRVITEIEQTREPLNFREKIKIASSALWSKRWYEKFLALLQEESVDLVHVYNFFPLISPSIYYACKKTGVPVVQTIQNYRLFCPTATFYRNGHVCEDCLGKTPPWPAILHACYHNSRIQSSVVAAMATIHRWLKTWQKQVDVYIAATDFSRKKFIQGGLPAEKIFVKPNFVSPDPGVQESTGQYALFVSRLSAEKGVRTLLTAWHDLQIPLKIVGDGPLLDEAVARVQKDRGLQAVDIIGWRPNQEVIDLMKGASFLVFPSEWYEGLPMTIVEAFACGVPTIAARLGAMAEIIEDTRTGLLFNPGNPDELAARADWLWSHPREAQSMGREARAEFESKYTAERNYQKLMEIYETALACRYEKAS